MKLPKHIALTITHNDHAMNYETIEHSLKNIRGNEVGDWISPEEREKAIATNEVWTCQWYPRTPIGFCAIHAATLEALMAALAEIADEETAATP